MKKMLLALATSVLTVLPVSAELSSSEQLQELASQWVDNSSGFNMKEGAVFMIVQKGETSFRVDHIRNIIRRGRLLLIDYQRGDDPKIHRAIVHARDVMIISE